MRERDAAQAVIVGAGVVGASIAYRLARAGARVTLIDRGEPGQGTSANSFAWVNSNDKTPRPYHRLNAESVIAHRRLRDDALADLARRSDSGTGAAAGAAMPPARDRQDRHESWLHEGGGLEWADEAGKERLLAKAARLKEWGYAVEVINEARAHEMEPQLRMDGFAAATFCSEEAWVDGPRLAREVSAAAAALGATVRTGEEVIGLERNGERVTAVRLASGERLPADWIVIAAGRWTDRVAALADVHVPLAPTCGLLAVTSPVTDGVDRAVHVPGMNFRPDPSGGLVLQSGPTDETVTAETPPDPALPGCATLLEKVRRFLPGVAGANIVEARVGVRPMPADGVSIVGPVEERPGLYLCVTHSGITLSALFGELVAAEITTGRPDERLAGFRPARCVTAGK